MPKTFRGNHQINKIYYGNKMIKKVYYGNHLVFSSGTEVNYIWNGNRTVEYVEEGFSALSPPFAPTKNGWTFEGWNTSQASPPLTSLIVTNDTPITLYAVWVKEVIIPDRNLSFSYDGAAEDLMPYYVGGNWTADVSIDKVTDIFNNTIGQVPCNISVGGSVGRAFVSIPLREGHGDEVTGHRIDEYTGYPGYGGATYTASGTESITAHCDRYEPWNGSEIYYKHYNGGDIHIRNVVKKGSTTIEHSYG